MHPLFEKINTYAASLEEVSQFNISNNSMVDLDHIVFTDTSFVLLNFLSLHNTMDYTVTHRFYNKIFHKFLEEYFTYFETAEKTEIQLLFPLITTMSFSYFLKYTPNNPSYNLEIESEELLNSESEIQNKLLQIIKYKEYIPHKNLSNLYEDLLYNVHKKLDFYSNEFSNCFDELNNNYNIVLNTIEETHLYLTHLFDIFCQINNNESITKLDSYFQLELIGNELSLIGSYVSSKLDILKKSLPKIDFKSCFKINNQDDITEIIYDSQNIHHKDLSHSIITIFHQFLLFFDKRLSVMYFLEHQKIIDDYSYIKNIKIHENLDLNDYRITIHYNNTNKEIIDTINNFYLDSIIKLMDNIHYINNKNKNFKKHQFDLFFKQLPINERELFLKIYLNSNYKEQECAKNSNKKQKI